MERHSSLGEDSSWVGVELKSEAPTAGMTSEPEGVSYTVFNSLTLYARKGNVDIDLLWTLQWVRGTAC